MAMFECPGCKRIVDDSIKKCPNCAYDIKKYVKAMMRDAKKSGKTVNESSLALSSVYSSDNSKSGALPKLDFLADQQSSLGSLPSLTSLSSSAKVPGDNKADQVIFESPSLNKAASAPAPAGSIFESPSLNKAASAPAAPAGSIFESPSLNKAASAPAAPAGSIFESPSLNKPAAPAESIFESPSLNKPAAPASTTFSVHGSVSTLGLQPAAEKSIFDEPVAPAVAETVATAAPEPIVVPNSVEEVLKSAPRVPMPDVPERRQSGMYTGEKFGSPEAVIPSATPSTSSIGQFSPHGTASSIQIEAPSVPAPERKPVVSTGSSVPPIPVYNDEPTPSALNNAPIFDSPILNAAQNSHTRLAQPASSASMSSISKPSMSYGNAPVAPVASTGGALSSLGASQPASAPAAGSVPGGYVFESAALNEQARKIATGEYTPGLKASQATLSMLEKDVSQLVANATISHRTFGQAPQATYKSMSPELGGGQPAAVHSANPLLSGATGQAPAPTNVYGQNNYSAPVGQSSLYGTGQPISASSYSQQANGQAPSYGSYGNATIPTNGQSGVGAQNPLLAGNPLLGGGRQ